MPLFVLCYNRREVVHMLLLTMIIGYLLGSIPTSLIIGKSFFHQDIRNVGSGNLGGTNASRAFGLKIGVLVIFLDGLKALISVFIGSLVSSDAAVYAGLMSVIGHCYPVFAQFKGGKGVASVFGYFLGTALFVTDSFLMFLSALIVFFLVLYKWRMVSLASIVAVGVGAITSLFQSHTGLLLSAFVLWALVIYRHRENIERIKNHNERTVSFKKKN